jgi:flagellar basal body rod protein FlgC
MKSVILLLISFSVFAHDKESYEIKLFCQDVNVIMTKLNASSSNLANINTTRTVEGGYYKRKIVKNCKAGHCEVYRDESPPILKYDPNHPDAKKNGYVAYPFYSEAEVKVEILQAQNAYEIVWANKPKSIESKDWVVGDKFKTCFENYKKFKGLYDFKSYLGR